MSAIKNEQLLGGMMQRQFSETDKLAAKLVCDADGEADHIKPWSGGGQTTVENCQILSSQANKAKGAFNFIPRKWQKLFIDRWNGRKPGCPFLLQAIPAAGKTFAALEVARLWMAAGPDRRIVVVVPSTNLRDDWQKDAHKFGIQLQSKEFTTNFRHGFQGGVATYHYIAKQPALFRKLCSVAPTMVIFDEVHHCGDDKDFGESIKEAFELAKEVLCLSGTPWQSDGTKIPFVTYDNNGFAVADFQYDYPHALQDDVVRFLVFNHSKGTITNDITGEETELHRDVSEDDASWALRRLLNPGGDYVRKQIKEAHEKLMELRRQIEDAACLALCIDQQHAIRIASVIEQVTGVKPRVIVSDEEKTNDTVDAFRNSKEPWLVSVRKVSEGTDIKRLQVLCWLTNTTSQLFFRQAIGRICRVRGIDDQEGYVFLPADPRLIANAENIQKAQGEALRELTEEEERILSERDKQFVFESYTTDHNGTDVVLMNNQQFDSQRAREFERLASKFGVPMVKVAAICNEFMPANTASGKTDSNGKSVLLEHEEDDLRRNCNRLAYCVAQNEGITPEEVHLRFSPRQAKMNKHQLEQKKRALIQMKKEALNAKRN